MIIFFIAQGEHGLQHHPGCFDVDHGQIGILDGCGCAHQTCLGDGMRIEFLRHKDSRDSFTRVFSWGSLVRKTFSSCGLG